MITVNSMICRLAFEGYAVPKKYTCHMYSNDATSRRNFTWKNVEKRQPSCANICCNF